MNKTNSHLEGEEASIQKKSNKQKEPAMPMWYWSMQQMVAAATMPQPYGWKNEEFSPY